MTNKIAIIHDSFIEFGGAERVLFSLLEIFPNADVYTSLIRDKFKNQVSKHASGKLIFSKLSNCNVINDHASLFKPYFFHYYWPSLNLDQYSLVISSSHSFCANFVKVKNKHISYIHTPPRFLYGEFNDLSWINKPIIKKIITPYFNYLRKKDQKNAQKIDIIIANSRNIKNKIEKYYNRKPLLVYPPVKLAKKIELKNQSNKLNYLFLSRLVKQKGIELIIKTFNQNQKPLVVVGTGKQTKKWQKLAKKNIRFLGFIEDKKIRQIYKKSKALIYASIQEDFGMVPVEAMSYGLPVIAYKDGGVKESVIDRKTGLFFNQYNETSLNETINKFENMKFKKEDCISQAKNFSEEKFKEKIKLLANQK